MVDLAHQDSGLEYSVSVKRIILDVLHKITLQVKKSLCNLFYKKSDMQ